MLVNASIAMPLQGSQHPVAVLVHGAANSSHVWEFWRRELAARGWASCAVDLRGHDLNSSVDLSHTTMQDYAEDVRSLAKQFGRPPVLVGWSMGGLIAIMVAASGCAAACVALAPSLPALKTDPSVELRAGEFGPEEYGITSSDPDDQPEMPDLDWEERLIALSSLSRESRMARDERRRGVVIKRLPCPLLIATGTLDSQWPRSRYDGLWLEADHLSVEDVSHWGLVLNRRALARLVPDVTAWLDGHVRQAVD